MIMTHRDDFSVLSVRRPIRSDAGHRKGRATRSESSEKTQVLSPLGRVGGRQQALEMTRIAPDRPAAYFLPDATQGRSLWVIIIKIWYYMAGLSFGADPLFAICRGI